MRLIDADALQEEFEKLNEARYNWRNPSEAQAERRGIDACLCALCDAPTIEPVRHGKWVVKKYNQNYTYYRTECSLCGDRPLEHWGKEVLSDFCPWCGARMDGGEDETN